MKDKKEFKKTTTKYPPILTENEAKYVGD